MSSLYSYEDENSGTVPESVAFDETFPYTRNLAGGDAPIIDYTALAMAVVAMSLLMIVAVVRHKIDQIAKGKEFFENVLEAVYHELSTLGIVEATVFLFHHYYADLNLQVERVFAEVHFTLFFCAIINAIMSTLLYFLASHVAENQWDKLETIDIDHYVAVRKQFDVIEKKMKDDATNDVDSLAADETGVFLKILKKTSNHALVGNLKQMLDMKYKQLLVQVRFHELRIHFIESNSLDPRFKVSKYLKLCMNDVFNDFVHISTFSWIILLACTNLLYFVTGIIAAKEKNQRSIGQALTSVFIGYGVVFVIFSYCIALNMKGIFFKIMKNERWISREADENEQHGKKNVLSQSTRRSNDSEEIIQQLRYFWGDDPTYIVVAAQFMQFGYALALSILLVFNNTIIIPHIPITWWGWYFVVPALCYALFVWLWSTIIPQYTQCTSLGGLVNKKHLHETQAMFELAEARNHRQDEIDFAETKKTYPGKDKKRGRKKPTKKKESASTDSKLTFLSKIIKGSAVSNTNTGIKDDMDLDSSISSLTGSQKLVQLGELVKKPANDLPEIRTQRKRLPRQRNRSVSDGVAAMRLFSSNSAMAAEALKSDVDVNGISKPSIEHRPTSGRSRRKKAVSTGVFLMQSEQTKSLFDEQTEGDEKSSFERNTMFGSHEVMQPPPPLTFETVGNCLFPPKQSDHELLPKSLQRKKFITTISEESLGENTSDGGGSDGELCDDMSEGVPDVVEHVDSDEVTRKIPLSERICTLYMSQSYRQASAVFGTMVAFFMIAIRIELILLDLCLIAENQNTWNFIGRSTAFWMYIVWLFIFFIESTIMATLFLKVDFHPHMVIAGGLDCMLAIACLALFLRAEVERCCDCEGTVTSRFLAPETKPGLCIPSYDCCPRFGDRLCGGVGTLEPIASIVALRLLRFYAGKRIWHFFGITRRAFKREAKRDSDEGQESSEQDLEGEEGGFRKDLAPDQNQPAVQKSIDSNLDGSSNFEYNTGTIAELWTSAVLKFPDIVDKHGMFSGLLLEAMLGIQPVPGGIATIGAKSSIAELKSQKVPESLTPSNNRKKSIYNRQLSVRSSGGLSSVGENNNEDNEYNFIRPASSLIRSMRRCQCKWLPLIDEWQVVDVLITKYELVWLGSRSIDGLWDEQIDSQREAVQSALRFKNGGKGLPLCDVVIGREVLGRLPLADIEQIKVHRFLPSTRKVATRKRKKINDVEIAGGLDDFNEEFWTDRSQKKYSSDRSPDSRWAEVTEDVLTLYSPQGALCLRFLVDLLDEEQFDGDRKKDAQAFRTKMGALLWCQTLSHLCGPQQLKQKLQHLGEERDKELLDFVEVAEKKRRNPLLRRFRSK